MPLEIKASGQINKDSGLTETIFHLIDPDAGDQPISVPQYIDHGHVEFKNEWNTVIVKVEFNRAHANSDGSIRVRTTRQIKDEDKNPRVKKARIVIWTTDDVELAKDIEIPVNIDINPEDRGMVPSQT